MKSILAGILCLATAGTFAQATYNVGEYGSPGYGFKQTTNVNNLGLFDFAQTGTNHTWNYVGLVAEMNSLKDTSSISGPADATSDRVRYKGQGSFGSGEIINDRDEKVVTKRKKT